MHLALGSRIRRLVLVLLAVAGLVAVTTPALAWPPGERFGRTYLALGDSVPFGYFGNAGPRYLDPDNFVGYPELVADDLRLRLLNASCPGETTASFIDADAQSNGCQNSVGSPIGFRDCSLCTSTTRARSSTMRSRRCRSRGASGSSPSSSARTTASSASAPASAPPSLGWRRWRPAYRRTWT